MLPKPLVPLAVVTLLLAAGHRQAEGTTVFPHVVACPVCGESFVVMRLASYSSFGEPARDLSDSSFARFGRVQVCPHCLYATLDSEFAALPAENRNALREFLKDPRLQLSREELQALSATDVDLRATELIVSAWLARQCYARCGTADANELSLRLLLFYDTIWHDKLHAFYRRRVIERLRQELSTGFDSDRQQIVNRYLLGELLRQDKQGEAALREFARASELAERHSKPFKEDDSRSLHWIVRWSSEQSLRIRFAAKTAEQLRPLLARKPPPYGSEKINYRKLAVDTLVDRTDRDAWRVLTDFAMQDPENLEHLAYRNARDRDKLRIDPRMWPLIEKHYAKLVGTAKRDDDLLSRMAGPSDTLHKILYEAESGDRVSEHVVATLMESLPDTPRDLSEDQVLAALQHCIQDGHRPAVNFFFCWCRKLDATSLDDQLLRISECLRALSAQPGLWSVPADLASSEIPEQRHLAVCLKFLRGDEAARQELLKCMARDRSCRGQLALHCFELQNDPAAVEMLVARPDENDEDDEDNDTFDSFMFNYYANDYLKRVATPAHLTAIKQRVVHQPLYKRDDTEEILRMIRFRELLRRNLPADTKRPSPTENHSEGRRGADPQGESEEISEFSHESLDHC